VRKLVGVRRRAVNELNAHLSEAKVDPGVVNYLIGQENTAVGKFAACFISEVEREVDAITEPELFGEPKGEAADLEGVALLFYLFNQSAVIIGDQRLSDFAFETEPTSHHVRLSGF
jgi:hypothetical protein